MSSVISLSFLSFLLGASTQPRNIEITRVIVVIEIIRVIVVIEITRVIVVIEVTRVIVVIVGPIVVHRRLDRKPSRSLELCLHRTRLCTDGVTVVHIHLGRVGKRKTEILRRGT
jgi:hypothetical protein